MLNLSLSRFSSQNSAWKPDNSDTLDALRLTQEEFWTNCPPKAELKEA